MKNKNKIIKLLVLIAAFNLGGLSTWAQLVPMDGQNGRINLGFEGQYDIRMISAPVMQPAWVSSTNPMTVIRIITNEEMFTAGDDLSLNNRYDWSVQNKSAWLGYRPTPTAVTSMVYADCDDDMSTFQSSAAKLDFGAEMGCTTVEAAYLYWMGHPGTATTYAPYNPAIPTMKSHAGGATGNTNNYQSVKFKTPGMASYVDVTSQRTVIPHSGDTYMCMADVTQYVKNKGGGLYWVGNVNASSAKGSGGCRAGWSLIVIFKPPNCPPRVIKIWDNNNGSNPSSNNANVTLNLQRPDGTSIVPASGNSISYLGFVAYDGEDTAPLILDNLNPITPAASKAMAEANRIVFNGGLGPKYIQPFTDGSQPPVHACNEKGICIDEAYSGLCSSQITSWDNEKGTNGNQLARSPDHTITLGYDAHHLRLPPNSISSGATSATMTLPDEQNGGLNFALAYMAIQTLQPDLKFTMSTETDSTEPGGDLTYILTVKNIGPLASQPGSYIINPLGKTIDYKDGSVKFYNKNGVEITPINNNTTPPGYTVTGAGTDNEEIRFYLPSIAAGTGSIANDSVVIKYTVTVKDLSRNDIWAYGCNREVSNSATLFYKADDGSDLEVGSNTTAGCGGLGTPENTEIVSQELQEKYMETHVVTIENEPGNPYASLVTDIQGGAQINIVTKLKEILAAQYTALGLNAAELSKYDIFDSDGFLVNPTAVFAIGENPQQQFTANATLDGGCEETFFFNLELAKIPKIFEDTEDSEGKINDYTSCVGAADGKLEIRVNNGTPGYSCKVNDGSGNQVFCGYSPSTEDEYIFIVEGLKAGTYTVVVMDQNGMSANKEMAVADPEALVVSLVADNSNICEGSSASLSGSVSGRDAGTSYTYAWKESSDGGTTWTNIPSGSGSTTDASFSLTPTINANTDYQLYVCDGICQASSAEVSISAIPIPSVSVADQVASVSSATPPTVTFTATDATTYPTTPSITFGYVWEVSKNNGSTWTKINGSSIAGFDGAYADYDKAGLKVSGITLNMNEYKFRATVSTDKGSCDNTSNAALLIVTEGPVLTPVYAAGKTRFEASCDNIQDAAMNFTVTEGDDLETYTISFYKGEYGISNPPVGAAIYSAPYTKTGVAVPFGPIATLEGKEAGTIYTAVAKPTDPSKVTTYFTYKVYAPAPVVVTLAAPDYACTGETITLTASVSGGDVSLAKSYVWSKSTDGMTFNPMSETTASINTLLDQDYTYKVEGFVGTCTVNIGADPTKPVDAKVLPVATITPVPTIVVLSDPRGSFEINKTAGDGIDTYRWEVSTDGGITWRTINANTHPGQYSNFNTAIMTVSNVDLSMDETIYRAFVKSEFGCETELSPVMLQVAKEPKITPTAVAVSCYDYKDGSASFTIQDGEPGQQYEVNFYKGYFDKDNMPDAFSETVAPQVTYELDAMYELPAIDKSSEVLPAGWYTVVAQPVGGLPGLQPVFAHFEITQPDLFTVTLIAPEKECEKANIQLEAMIYGGPEGESTSYSWYVGTDEFTLTEDPTYVTRKIQYPSTEDFYFQVFATKGICDAQSSVLRVRSIPTPEIEVLPIDTGCFHFNLADLRIEETTGVSGYKTTIHSAMPKSATDNSHLITGSNNDIYKHTVVYAMLSVEDMCYSVAPVSIYIKNIDECYPLIVPKMFSPDGDGINDRLVIEGAEEYRNFKIKIFNRYGKKVFEGEREQVMEPYGWDGTYNGNELPSGDYWWRISADGIKEQHGTFSIKRGK
jgi:gliding motility-associated-like protein